MIEEIKSNTPHPEIIELLSYAVSSKKAHLVYNDYIEKGNQRLFGMKKKDRLIACIGIEIQEKHCEIKHIAVSPDDRGQGVGSLMIQWILDHFSIEKVIAETDHEAVDFYKNFGFSITSLGEIYPNVERFLCEYER